MKCTTRGVPTASQYRLHSQGHEESTEDHHAEAPAFRYATPSEQDRVLAILAMGGDGVPPTLVRRAVDEYWSVDKAAKEFRQPVRARVA